MIERAPENVRHIRPDEDVSPLADNIAAHGLLQSLIGYLAPNEKGVDRCWIVGGGRRLQALNLLLDRGALTLDFPVPVLVRDRDDAIELSLSENLAKRDMSPVDECRAFAALMARGDTSPLELAKRFGFGERYVRQRLRLADLAPEILDALGDRKITLPAAEAYARSTDPFLQLDVFKAQERSTWDQHSPQKVRAAYDALQATTASPIFRFVGAEIYERDGGGYEDDLFTGKAEAADRRKLSHGHLLLTKAIEMVQFQAIRLEDEFAAELPGFVGFVVPPNARTDTYPWKAPTPPRGQVLVESNDPKALWNNAKASRAAVTLIVGIDVRAEIAVLRNKFFVDKAALSRVRTSTSAPLETPAQRAAREREAEIDRLQWRLAVPAFAGTPYEGRAFWSRDWARPVETSTDARFAGGRLVAVQIFVTDVEHDATRAAAERQYDEAKAAETAAAQARKRREDLAAELIRMDPPPEVIAVGGHPYYRKPDGEWCEDPAQVEDPDKLGQFAGIADLLRQFDHDEPIERFMSIEAYRATVPANAGDA